jgi:hypothetical protein
MDIVAMMEVNVGGEREKTLGVIYRHNKSMTPHLHQALPFAVSRGGYAPVI